VIETSCKDSFDLFKGLYKCNPSSRTQLVKIREALNAMERELQEDDNEREISLHRLSLMVKNMRPSATAVVTDKAAFL